MIAHVARMFQRRDPQRDVTLALARITTLSHTGSLPWESGVYDDRRARDEVYTAPSVWGVPVTEGCKAGFHFAQRR